LKILKVRQSVLLLTESFVRMVIQCFVLQIEIFFICDTYPDEHKERTLFFYNFEDGTRTDVGKFRMIDERPDMTLQATYFDGLDKNILSLFTPEQLAFTRSGLHCDLHPRWDANGKMVAFDSIHEGSRQIYVAHNPFYKETTE